VRFAPEFLPNRHRDRPERPLRRGGVFLTSVAAFMVLSCAAPTEAPVVRDPVTSLRAVDFGTVTLGQSRDTIVSLTNLASSTAPLAGTVSISGSGFTVVSGGGTFSIAAGQAQSITIRFAPGSATIQAGALSITHDGTTVSSPLSVPLTGIGGDSGIVLTLRTFAPTGLATAGLRAVLKTSNSSDTLLLNSLGIGSARIATPPASDSIEILIDAVSPSARVFIPALFYERVPLTDTITAAIVPMRWAVRGGSYAGQQVDIGMNTAFLASPGTAWNRFIGDGANYPRWPSGYMHWRALPVPVSFARDSSTGPISAADSTNIWATLESMNTTLGITTFVPADYLGYRARLAEIHIVRDTTLTAGGGTGPTWRARDNATGLEIISNSRVSYGNRPDTGYVIGHEAFHALGFGHACYWPSLMANCPFGTGPGGAGTTSLTSSDVAYFQVVYAILWLQDANGIRHGLDAAIMGQRRELLGLSPLPCDPLGSPSPGLLNCLVVPSPVGPSLTIAPELRPPVPPNQRLKLSARGDRSVRN